jgi:hypothetical protein
MRFGKNTQNRTSQKQSNFTKPIVRLFGREKMFTPSTASYFFGKGNNMAIHQDWASFRLAIQFLWLILNTPISF